jgi:hypothetical protein
MKHRLRRVFYGEVIQMKTKAEILALLVDLGSTADEVAAKLISFGIKGEREKCSTCPVAQYLFSKGVVAKINDPTWFGLGGVGIGVDSYWYPLATYPQLTGVFNFIRAFDRGQYPGCEA